MKDDKKIDEETTQCRMGGLQNYLCIYNIANSTTYRCQSVALKISDKIKEKLAKKHCVKEEEVAQCFANKIGNFLLDTREGHDTDPPTLWFIAETDYGRKLKIVFIHKDGDNYLRSAFDPNAEEVRIYDKRGR